MTANQGTTAGHCRRPLRRDEITLCRELNRGHGADTVNPVTHGCARAKIQHRGLSGRSRYALFILAYAIICFNTSANAEINTCRVGVAATASTYEQLVTAYPASVMLRLGFADALTCGRQWARAISEYEEVIKLQPNNAQARLGLDTLQRQREKYEAIIRKHRQEAEAAAERGDFATAASTYEHLLTEQPASIALRLNYASALKNDRQWEQAISEYQAVIERQPDNTEAALGIGTVRRWQGDIDEALRTYEQTLEQSPQNTEALLGLADTYALDHDYAVADKLYEQAQQMWPGDSGVQQAAYDFHRRSNPRLYLFWENDLSFESHQVGFIVPFAAREEIGLEYQKETSIAPQLDNAKIYSRSDNKILYTHYFGLNHMLDFSARSSEYTYNVPDTDLGYSAIDSYREYRARYTLPITPEQIFSLRYTARPTILKLSQHSFTALKLEAELNSRWLPRFFTLLGGGWLRDLDENALSASELTDRSLVKLGFHWDITNRLSFGAKYITNPDLDNSMTATTIGEASYSLNNDWSLIGRHRADDYRISSDQTSSYLGIRFTPNSHWWSEFGMKYAERGDSDGNFGLASVVYHF